MNIVFLFGAGASYGSCDCSPYCPPLGKWLFPDLLKQGGIVATLDEEHRQLFQHDFERGMERFIQTHNIHLTTLLREMSKYFIQFTPGPNNLYRRLVNYLGHRQKGLGEQSNQRSVLATLNYDLLLEQAIVDTDYFVVYPKNPDTQDKDFVYQPNAVRLRQNILNSYWAKYNALCPVRTSVFEVLKVHGSCNFLPNIPPENFRRITYENVGVAVEGPAVPVLPAKHILDWLQRSDSSLAPAISMYAEGKQVLFSRRYIQEHQSRFQAAVREAEKIFLIGVAIHRPDTHIWEHIAASNAWLGYVGGEPDDFQAWCSETKHSNYFVLGTKFGDALPAIEKEIDNAVP